VQRPELRTVLPDRGKSKKRGDGGKKIKKIETLQAKGPFPRGRAGGPCDCRQQEGTDTYSNSEKPGETTETFGADPVTKYSAGLGWLPSASDVLANSRQDEVVRAAGREVNELKIACGSHLAVERALDVPPGVRRIE